MNIPVMGFTNPTLGDKGLRNYSEPSHPCLAPPVVSAPTGSGVKRQGSSSFAGRPGKTAELQLQERRAEGRQKSLPKPLPKCLSLREGRTLLQRQS